MLSNSGEILYNQQEDGLDLLFNGYHELDSRKFHISLPKFRKGVYNRIAVASALTGSQIGGKHKRVYSIALI